MHMWSKQAHGWCHQVTKIRRIGYLWVSYFRFSSFHFFNENSTNFRHNVSSTIFFDENSNKHRVRRKVTSDGKIHLTKWFSTKCHGSELHMQTLASDHVWTAKTQVSLHICAVWSGPSRSASKSNKILKFILRRNYSGWTWSLLQFTLIISTSLISSDHFWK